MSFDLSNQYVSQSYQNLVQISGSILTTGLGTSINQLNITGVTASLIGTSSWAINAVTASFAPGYVLTSTTSSMKVLSSSYAVTASFAPGYVLTSQTASIVLGYVLTSSTGSMLQPYVLTSTTSSMLQPYVLTSTTSSMKVLSSSYAVTASYANFAANSNIATTGSTLYSTNPITSNVATVNSIFLGVDAGRDATDANGSNFLGQIAGYQATNAEGSNFIGGESGQYATNASFSNFLGQGAGGNATNANSSNFLGSGAGNGATNANDSNFLGSDAGESATDANNSNFIGAEAGALATSASYSNFFGNQAGYEATNANNSNFLGYTAGYQAINASNSNFLGLQAGSGAISASYSNFLGNQAGYQATGASYSNFLGSAGYQATNASYSNFLGFRAGHKATNAYRSNFLGLNAGDQATGAQYSNFLGYQAGSGAISASYSNLFGYNVGSNNIGSNNIIIGTNVTLANGRKDSINLGGIIFATGSHNSLATKLSGSVTNAKVGICNSLPLYTLDVSGSGKFTDGVNVTGSLLSIGEVNLKNPYNSNIQLLITSSYDPLGLGDPSNVIATQAQSASFSTGFGTYISTGSNADLGTNVFCRNSASGDLVGVSIDYASDDNTLGANLAYFVNNFTDFLSIGVFSGTAYTVNSKTVSGSRNFTAFNGDEDRLLELYNNGDYVQTNVTSSIAFVNLGNASVGGEFTQSFAGIVYTKDSGGDDWLIANTTIVGTSGSNTVIENRNILIDNNSNQRTEIINTVSNAIDGVQYITISHENTSTDDIHQVAVSPLGATISSDTTNEGTMVLTTTSGSVYIGEDPQIGLMTMTIKNSGHVILPFISSSFNYANDAAAALGNVPKGGIYHTSGSLKIRLT